MSRTKKIIVLVGLPHSGQHRWISTNYPGHGGIVIKTNDLLRQDAGGLRSHIKVGYNPVYVVGGLLYTNGSRKAIGQVLERLAPGIPVKWVFFENNPEVCELNVPIGHANRANVNYVSERYRLIRRMSKVYVLPSNVKPLKVIDERTAPTLLNDLPFKCPKCGHGRLVASKTNTYFVDSCFFSGSDDCWSLNPVYPLDTGITQTLSCGKCGTVLGKTTGDGKKTTHAMKDMCIGPHRNCMQLVRLPKKRKSRAASNLHL